MGEPGVFWFFDQFIWRPKTTTSFCIIVIARTSTSSISASSATSSAKSMSVSTSFHKVTRTLAIPRCAVRSIIWSIGPRNKSGTILQPCRTPLPTANQSDNTPSPEDHQRQHAVSTDTTKCVRLPWDPQLYCADQDCVAAPTRPYDQLSRKQPWDRRKQAK